MLVKLIEKKPEKVIKTDSIRLNNFFTIQTVVNVNEWKFFRQSKQKQQKFLFSFSSFKDICDRVCVCVCAYVNNDPDQKKTSIQKKKLSQKSNDKSMLKLFHYRTRTKTETLTLG